MMKSLVLFITPERFRRTCPTLIGVNTGIVGPIAHHRVTVGLQYSRLPKKLGVIAAGFRYE